MQLRKILILTMLLVCELCFSQFTDEQLFAAYLQQDMSLWREYISTFDWKKANKQERLRLLNYEYGFTAFEIDANPKSGKHFLQLFQQHTEQMKAELSTALYYTYLSAINAFEFKLDKTKLFSSGLNAFRLAHKAEEADKNNPIALTLAGNVDFYAPSAFGGDKARALNKFETALTLLRNNMRPEYQWNYAATMLCVAQCYEHLGQRQSAIRYCQQILAEYPNFAYIRDIYLPQLLKSNKQ